MKTARFMCTISDHSGNRFKGDPRWVLEKMVEKAKDKGYIFNVGPEFEFFLFNMDDRGTRSGSPRTTAVTSTSCPWTQGEMVRKDIMLNFDDHALRHGGLAP